jgi:hypothetical protein
LKKAALFQEVLSGVAPEAAAAAAAEPDDSKPPKTPRKSGKTAQA